MLPSNDESFFGSLTNGLEQRVPQITIGLSVISPIDPVEKVRLRSQHDHIRTANVEHAAMFWFGVTELFEDSVGDVQDRLILSGLDAATNNLSRFVIISLRLVCPSAGSIASNADLYNNHPFSSL